MSPGTLHWLKSLSGWQFVGLWALFDLLTDCLLLAPTRALWRAWRRRRRYRTLRAQRAARP